MMAPVGGDSGQQWDGATTFLSLPPMAPHFCGGPIVVASITAAASIPHCPGFWLNH